MTLHPPKRISSFEGLGVNTTKTMQRVNDQVYIGTEVWNEMNEPWREGETVIAQPGYKWTTKWEVGKPYIITKFQDAASNLIAIYCDVARPVEVIDAGFEFTDLYLDIWQPVGEAPVILDEQELAGATEAGYITSEEADATRRIAAELISSLINDQDFLDF